MDPASAGLGDLPVFFSRKFQRPDPLRELSKLKGDMSEEELFFGSCNNSYTLDLSLGVLEYNYELTF